MGAILLCPKCKAPLASGFVNTGTSDECLGCHSQMEVELFPAFFQRKLAASSHESLTVDSDASCFYHAENKAAVVCESCGRFICGLCDVELKGQHLCPNCVESGFKKGKIKDLQNKRVLYDNIALALAILPMIMVWPTILTAPAAIIYAIKGWKKPGSIIPRTKARFIIAIIIASAQIIGWTALLIYLLFGNG